MVETFTLMKVQFTIILMIFGEKFDLLYQENESINEQ
jgi:hypothetical protein